MELLFVDTGVWVGAYSEKDGLHTAAVDILRAHRDHGLVLTEHLLVEAMSLLRRHLSAERTAELGLEFLGGRLGTVVRCTEGDLKEAMNLIRRYGELKLSLADAAAMAVIRRLGIRKVASFDKHFRIVLNERTVLPTP